MRPHLTQQRSPRTMPRRGPGAKKMCLPRPRYGPIDLDGSIRSDGCTMIPGEQNAVDSLWANPSAPFSLLLSRSSLRRARPMKHRQSTSSAAASPLYLFYPTSEMARPEAEKSAPPRAPSPARAPTDGSTRRHRVAFSVAPYGVLGRRRLDGRASASTRTAAQIHAGGGCYMAHRQGDGSSAQ
jgi:hypothetical protein